VRVFVCPVCFQTGETSRLYHQQLEVLLQGVVDAQIKGVLFPFSLEEGKEPTWKLIKCPVALIITDCKGGDSLAGKYGGHSAQRISRHCTCLFEDADKPNHVCMFNQKEAIQDLIDEGTNDELKAISQHRLQNAFSPVSFGDSTCGVHGCTTIDLMHSLQHGIMMKILSLIFDPLNTNNSAVVDDGVKRLAELLRQSCREDFPRSDFTNGITNLTLKTCSEQSGSIFVLALFLQTAYGACVFNAFYDDEGSTLKGYQIVLEKLLFYESWTKRTSFWAPGDLITRGLADKAIRSLLADIKKYCPREEGQGWKVPKFHEQLHLPRFIEEYGSPQNFDAGPCETHHKTDCKKPADTAQKRHSVFTEQCAERYAENLVIDKATRIIPPEVLLPPTFSYLDERRGVLEYTEEVDSDDEGEHSNKASRFFLAKDEVNDDGVGLFLYDRNLKKNEKYERFWNVPPGVIEYLLSCYYADGDVTRPLNPGLEFVSEYSRRGTRFRAHWNYRHSGPWQDWAIVDWGPSGQVPGKILMFAKHPPLLSGASAYDAIIVSGSGPLRGRTKGLTRKFTLDAIVPRRPPAGQPHLPNKPRYTHVNAMALVKHCLVLADDQADDPLQMLLVLDRTEWCDMFLPIPTQPRRGGH
jgi:hypothetical protein